MFEKIKHFLNIKPYPWYKSNRKIRYYVYIILGLLMFGIFIKSLVWISSPPLVNLQGFNYVSAFGAIGVIGIFFLFMGFSFIDVASDIRNNDRLERLEDKINFLENRVNNHV